MSILLLSAALLICTTSFATDDDVVAEPTLRVSVLQNALFSERVTDQRIYGSKQAPSQFESKMTDELGDSIRMVDKASHLTESQKVKLRMAGRADYRQFLDRVTSTRTSVREEGLDLGRQIAELQVKVKIGMLGPDSRFAKTIRTVLTIEQIERCQQQHKLGLIDALMLTIESETHIQPEQRKRLIELIGPLTTYGSPAYEQIFWVPAGHFRDSQIRRLKTKFVECAEKEVKPLLEPNQWQNLQPVIAEWHRVRIVTTD